MTKKDECLKALECLYLEVDATIADDVKRKVLDALDEENKISSYPMLNEVGAAVEEELHFKTQWEAMSWMREQLWKRGLEINPLHKDFEDKVWLRHSERNKFDTQYYTTKDVTNG